MTRTLRPYIRVCLILVKDIKLWWVPAFTSPRPSLAEDSAGVHSMCVHPCDSQQEMTHKRGAKVLASSWHSFIPKKLHIHFGNFCYLWSTTKGDACVSRGTAERVPGEWEQSSGAAAECAAEGEEGGVGKTGWMCCRVTAAEATVAVTTHHPAACKVFPTMQHVRWLLCGGWRGDNGWLLSHGDWRLAAGSHL